MKKILLLLLFALPINGKISDSMNKFYSKFGIKANKTNPAVFTDQAAGYFTGGGLSVRGRVIKAKPINVSFPEVNVGSCGDIDLFLGAFSFSKEQLVKAMRGVISSAASYAFMLAIDTVSPQIATTMKQIQDWINKKIDLEINSCELGAHLVSSAFQKRKEVRQKYCKMYGAENKKFSDFIAGRVDCSSPSERDQVFNEAEKQDDSGILKRETNIANEVLEKSSLNLGGKLKELFMSISGTIVSRKTGVKDHTELFYYPSLAVNEEFMNALMEGGSAKVYTCDNKQCLQPKESAITLEPSSAFRFLVENKMKSMQTKALTDGTFDEEEKELLNKTRIPLLKIINIISAYKYGYAPITLVECADLVAVDMLCQYLNDIIDTLRIEAERLKEKQFDTEMLDKFTVKLNELSKRVRLLEQRTQEAIQKAMLLEEKTRLLEKEIFGSVKLV